MCAYCHCTIERGKHTWSIHCNSCNNLGVWVVWIKRQRVASTDLQRNGVSRRNGLKHAHHVMVGEAQDTGRVHVHQGVA
jgi:hypothetical protein